MYRRDTQIFVNLMDTYTKMIWISSCFLPISSRRIKFQIHMYRPKHLCIHWLCQALLKLEEIVEVGEGRINIGIPHTCHSSVWVEMIPSSRGIVVKGFVKSNICKPMNLCELITPILL